jgi:membrane associated rhomboid family serine protease
VFGWLLERRHGSVVVLALFVLGGVGGVAATAALVPNAVVIGAGGAGLAFVVAWMIPDLLDLRAGEEIEGDLIGSAVFGGVVALMPLVVSDASWVADGVGVLAGGTLGLALAGPDLSRRGR